MKIRAFRGVPQTGLCPLRVRDLSGDVHLSEIPLAVREPLEGV